MSGTPMSNEQRAALEQRLAQLRAAQAAAAGNGAAHPSSSSGAPSGAHPAAPIHQQQQNASQSTQPPPQMSYDYDANEDEDEEEFDLDRQQFEEEFLSMLSQPQNQAQSHRQAPFSDRNAASVAQVNATRHADEGVSIVATDKTAQRPRELGDFEMLRLAKMGDMVSMLDFGSACGVDWKTFVDNHGRNALHYAADAGSAALVRKLVDDLRVPYVADEKQLTPLDVAVLNGHNDVETDEVVAALVAAATSSRHADAKLTDPKVKKTLESVLQAHAPAPPKFVMSKPVPKPEEGSAKRSFWSVVSSSSSATEAVQCSSGADMSAEEAAAVTADVNALDTHGRLDWLLPVTRGAQAPCKHWTIARTVSSGDEKSCTAMTTTGIVVAQVLADTTVEGPAALKIKKFGDAPVKVVVAAHLGVRGTARRTGVAASLLHTLRTRLFEKGEASNAVVFFASGTQLPRPPSPLATVKWYRRVFDAVSVYAADNAYDVFPDFYNYDTTLRADAVLKGAVPESLFTKYAADLPQWCNVDPALEEQCALVLDFIAKNAGTPASSVDLVCVPHNVAELRRCYLGHPDHRAYVRTNAQDGVTDLVVFRRRDARKESAKDTTFAVEVAFALFTSIKGTAKADHMILLASKLLTAKMLLVPTLFGITDSDLVKSNFDELVSCREFLYGVSPSTLKEVEGLGAVPASKLSLPLFSI